MSNEIEWEKGVCGCFDDCSLCVLTFFCPCYTFGKTAEAVGSQCCLMGCAMLTPFSFFARLHIRERIRQKKDLKGTFASDQCKLAICWFCTLCQEAQEVKDNVVSAQSMVRE